MLFEARPSQDHACPIYNHTQGRHNIPTFLASVLVNPPDIVASSLKDGFLFRGTRVANFLLTQQDEISRPRISKGGFNGFTKQR